MRWVRPRWLRRKPSMSFPGRPTDQQVTCPQGQVRARVRLAVRLAQEAGSANPRPAGALLGTSSPTPTTAHSIALAGRHAYARR